MKLGIGSRFSVRIVALALAGIVTPGCAAGSEADSPLPPNLAGEDVGNASDTELNVDAATEFDAEGDGSTACVAKSVAAEQIPLDMLILLDASTSMLDPATTPQKWSSAVDALTQFFDDPASKGISVGLSIFPVIPTGTCSAATYKKPQIDYGTLPGTRAALVKAIADTDPKVNDATPLHSVLEGGLAGAIDWKKAHPGHAVVAVLATDGKSTCITSVDPTTSATNARANGVQTYAIGMKGADLTQLNAIASAGGTKKAYDATNIALFSKQMQDIRAAAMPCEVLIPPPPAGETFDRNKVNVVYTPGGSGAANTIPYVASASGCGTTGGWYYDNDTAPTKVVYCPSTCTSIQSDKAPKVDVAFGCKSVIK